MNVLHRLQAEWDTAAANDNTPECDRPSLRSVVGGAGLVGVVLVVWKFVLLAVMGSPA